MKKESNPSSGTNQKPPPPPAPPRRSIRDDEVRIRRILNDIKFKEDGSMFSNARYLSWNARDIEATLDGDFNADELEAIAWWMRHKSL